MKLTSTDLKAKYYRLNPKGHFFDKETMRFFKSRIEAVLQDDYFITSESRSFRDDTRVYTVRQLMGENDHVREIGEFGEHDTLKQARKALKNYRKEN